MKKLTHIFIAAAILLCASCVKDSFTGTQGENAGGIGEEAGLVSGEVLVKFDASLTDILDEITGGTGVRTKSGVHTVDEVLAAIDGYSIERVFPVDAANEERTRQAGLHLWYLVKFDSERSMNDVIARLSALGEVKNATPVRQIVKAYSGTVLPVLAARSTERTGSSTFNDPLLPYQWHLENKGWADIYSIDGSLGFDETVAKAKFAVGSDVNVAPVWADGIQGDPSIIVAILDEGVCLEHPDLKESIWVNEGETWGSDVDADGNGYAGDVHGYDFLNKRGLISWDDVDDTGHGTHVAGVIAAVNNNNEGISSIAGGTPGNPGVKIMSCQVFSGNSASNTADLVRAIKYAADNGAVVLQCSWGYNSGAGNMYEWGQGFADEETWAENCPLEKSVLDYFIHNAGSADGPITGGIPVFAAGNESAPMAGFPGASEGCISVASVAADFTPSVFSNYDTYVKIAAPGGDQDYYYEFKDDEHQVGQVGCVLSTLPTHVSESGYGYMEGTSMACPHVSGAVALALSYAKQQRRHYSAAEFIELLTSTCTDLSYGVRAQKSYYRYVNDVGYMQRRIMNLNAYNGKMGAGLVNVDALLNAVATGGVQMVFPNVYLGTGDSKVYVPSVYLDGESFEIQIDDASVAKVGVTELTSSADQVGAGVNTASGNKITFYGVGEGMTTAKITARPSGTVQTFNITVRKSVGGQGWL